MTLIPTTWTPEAEAAAYEALAGVPWAQWGRPLLHGREFDDYGPGLINKAMGKAIVTMMHCLETAIQVHGRMPKPGVPSGEVI